VRFCARSQASSSPRGGGRHRTKRRLDRSDSVAHRRLRIVRPVYDTGRNPLRAAERILSGGRQTGIHVVVTLPSRRAQCGARVAVRPATRPANADEDDLSRWLDMRSVRGASWLRLRIQQTAANSTSRAVRRGCRSLHGSRCLVRVSQDTAPAIGSCPPACPRVRCPGLPRFRQSIGVSGATLAPQCGPERTPFRRIGPIQRSQHRARAIAMPSARWMILRRCSSARRAEAAPRSCDLGFICRGPGCLRRSDCSAARARGGG